MKTSHIFSAGLLSLGAMLASSGHAAPVQYNFTGGSATFTLTSAFGQLLNPSANTVALTGTQVTFDSVAMTLPSFQFTDTGPSVILGQGVLAGQTFTLNNLNIVPDGTTYSSSAIGSNPYTFTAGKIDVSGDYTISGGIAPGLNYWSSVNNSFTGQLTIGGAGATLALNGITLGLFTLPGALGQATLKADVLFTGGAVVVPVPAAVWLLSSALGLAGLPLMKRRGGI